MCASFFAFPSVRSPNVRLQLPELAALDASGLRTAAPIESSIPVSASSAPPNNFSTFVSVGAATPLTAAPLQFVASPSVTPPKATVPASRPPPTKKESEGNASFY